MDWCYFARAVDLGTLNPVREPQSLGIVDRLCSYARQDRRGEELPMQASCGFDLANASGTTAGSGLAILRAATSRDVLSPTEVAAFGDAFPGLAIPRLCAGA